MGNESQLARAYLENGKVDDCPVIDCHAHHGPHNAIYMPNRGFAESMIRYMDRCGVRLAVCAPHAGLFGSPDGNAVMARVIEKWPQRFLGYICVNPNYPERIERDVEEYGSLPGVAGFKFLSSYHKIPITSARYRPALGFARDRGLVVLMHTWGKDEYCGVERVRELSRSYPDVPMLLGHSCYGAWDEVIALAKSQPNLYLELCAAYAVPGVIDRFVSEVGSERVLFGTDLPWFDPHYGIGCVLWSRITDEDRHNILHRNAEQLFRKHLHES